MSITTRRWSLRVTVCAASPDTARLSVFCFRSDRRRRESPAPFKVPRAIGLGRRSAATLRVVSRERKNRSSCQNNLPPRAGAETPFVRACSPRDRIQSSGLACTQAPVPGSDSDVGDVKRES